MDARTDRFAVTLVGLLAAVFKGEVCGRFRTVSDEEE